MQFVQNFPFMGILLTLICAVITSVLKGAAARRMTVFVIGAVTAMTAAVAAAVCAGPVTFQGAQAVNKSYPTFFDDFNRLGGKAGLQ